MKKAVLADNPVCEECNIAPSTEVHHKQPPTTPEELLSYSNLAAVCNQCHKRLTALQRRWFIRR